MKCNIFLLFVGFIIISFSVVNVFSKELSLTISESIERALKSNLDIQLQKSTLDKLTWDNVWKWSSILPTVAVSANLSRSNEKPANPASSQWGLNRSISISSPIGPLLVKKVLEVFGAHFAFEKGEITYEKAIKTVLVSVQKAYYDLLITRKELFILEKQLQVNIEQNKDLKTSYESGLVEEYTYLKNQLQKLKIEKQINAKQNSIVSFSNTFANIIGEDVGTQFMLVEDVPDISEETIKSILLKNSLDNNYDIRVSKMDKLILNLTQYSSLLALLPTLDLSWASSNALQGDPFVKDWYSDDNWSKDSGSVSFSLSFSISNLLPGSPVFLAYIDARTNYKNHSINTKKTKDSLKLRLVNLQNTLQLNMRSLNISQNQRTLARTAFEIMQEKYDNGLARLTEYQTAENDLLDAEKGYLLQVISIVKSMLDIQLLLGEENAY